MIKKVKKKKVERKLKDSKKVKLKTAVKQPKNIGKQPHTPPKKNQADRLKPHRWKKGDPSPNPSGRPKGSLSLTAALRKLLSQKGKTKKEKYKELMDKLYEQASEGSPKLMQLIFDRIDGKVPDRVITTDTGPLSDIDEDKLDKIINAGKPDDQNEEEPTQ